MSRAVEVVTVSLDQLRAFIGEAVAVALDDQQRRADSGARSLSAVRAARMAHCQDGYFLKALANGAIQGRKVGNRWAVLASDVADWVRRGKPLERAA